MKEISDTKIYAACREIAQRIKTRTPNNFSLVAVSRGGLVPTTIIAHWLGVKEIKFIRLSSYDDEQKQTKITDTTTDKIANEETTYIIDDICDSGETVLFLRQKYSRAQIYTLINKNPNIQPDFAPITESQGVWINFPWEIEDRENI